MAEFDHQMIRLIVNVDKPFLLTRPKEIFLTILNF